MAYRVPEEKEDPFSLPEKDFEAAHHMRSAYVNKHPIEKEMMIYCNANDPISSYVPIRGTYVVS